MPLEHSDTVITDGTRYTLGQTLFLPARFGVTWNVNETAVVELLDDDGANVLTDDDGLMMLTDA